MANKRTKLLRYAKTSQGWRLGNAIIGKTGKVKPDYMLYKKQDLYCPEGYFIIRTYVGKQPKYKDVGNDAYTESSQNERGANRLAPYPNAAFPRTADRV